SPSQESSSPSSTPCSKLTQPSKHDTPNNTVADTSVRAVVEAGFHAAGLIPRAAGEATYMMTAVGMVQAGLGITILPSSAQEIRADPTLQARAIEAVGFVRQISLVKKSGRTLSPLAALFVHHFCDMTAR
ncbi:LysR substrate binding domain-containing protein, partial [Bosea sp. OK403]|uniref:LysR substrate-binding domain-containing protein n=1 Tax=Bosea sp. OK403 TaxID=1855286 RepID=UPI0008F39417